MSSITKILFRQGANLVRTLQNVVFDIGEPAYTVDTKRLYIGDGITIGGIPVGVRNLGSYNPVFSAVNVYHSSVLSAVSAAEYGDLIYDKSSLTLYFAITANPTASQWSPYNFAGISLSGFNGVTVTNTTGTLSAQLDPTIFNVTTPNVTLNYNLLVTNSKGISAQGNINSSGVVSDATGNSIQWNSNYTTVNGSSANWNTVYSNYTNGYLSPRFITPVLLSSTNNAGTPNGWTTFNITPFISALNITPRNAIVNTYLELQNGGAVSPTPKAQTNIGALSSSSFINATVGIGGINLGYYVNDTTQTIVPLNYPNNTFQWTFSCSSNGGNKLCNLYLMGCW